MPILSDVIPALVEDDGYRDSIAFDSKDCQVLEIKLATGAPCSSHSKLFAPWPGQEEGVEKWYILDNGMAVGTRLNEQGIPEFPVFEMDVVID